MKTLVAFGTRPEAVKLAPVIKKLDHIIVLNTGQHRELLQPVLELFNIKPNYNLDCFNPDLLTNFHCISLGTREVIRKEEPDVVMVQGDTLTTFAVSFAAFLEKVPIIHLEAGLRSKDKLSPFPEEMFRLLTDDLADVYLVPTKKAYMNLVLEGKREDRIFIVGNTVIDALHLALEYMDEDKEYKELSEFIGIKEESFKAMDKVLITSHRRESFGEPMRRICRAVKRIAIEYPDTLFLWSLHKNPEVRKVVLEELNYRPENLVLSEALSYTHTVLMLRDSEVILTDSGGIQEEAPTFGKPVLVLRDVTERIEAYEAGFSFIVGTDEENIVETFRSVYKNQSLKEELSKKPNPYGDGKSADRIKFLYKCESFRNLLKSYKEKGYLGGLDDCKNIFA